MIGREITLLFAGVFFVNACSSADDGKLFYKSGDRAIYLSEDQDLAVIPASDTSKSAASVSIRALDKNLEIYLPYLRRKTGFNLVKRGADVSPDVFRRSMTVLQGPDDDFHPLVYRADQAAVVLTDTFTIQFKKPMKKKAVLDVLNDHLDFKFTPKQADLEYSNGKVRRRPFLWKVTIADQTPPQEALKQINDLHESPLVSEAFPDFVTIQLDRYIDLRIAMMMLQNLSAKLPKHTGTCSQLSVNNIPNDEYFGRQWHLSNTGTSPNQKNIPEWIPGNVGNDIDALEGWEITKASEEIVIAVIDVGVDADHADLSNVLKNGLNATGIGDAKPLQGANHGTRVAGLLAAETNEKCRGVAGVARGARILPVKFADIVGGHLTVTAYGASEIESAINAAIDWEGDSAGDNEDVDVIVMAWHIDTADIPLVTNAIHRALTEGIVVVVAAGNYSIGDSGDIKYPASLAASTTDCNIAPTTCNQAQVFQDGLIVVGATTQTDRIKKVHACVAGDTDPNCALDPDGGPSGWGSRFGDAVSLSAPGLWMTTTDYTGSIDPPPYVNDWDGTSAAVPLVGGAAALLLTCYPQATPEQIKRWLENGAETGFDQSENNGTPVWDQFYGHGRLSISGALKYAIQDMQPSNILPGSGIASNCAP